MDHLLCALSTERHDPFPHLQELTPDQRIEDRASIERLPDHPFLGFAAGNGNIS
jgi:hypothetical protein